MFQGFIGRDVHAFVRDENEDGRTILADMFNCEEILDWTKEIVFMGE